MGEALRIWAWPLFALLGVVANIAVGIGFMIADNPVYAGFFALAWLFADSIPKHLDEQKERLEKRLEALRNGK